MVLGTLVISSLATLVGNAIVRYVFALVDLGFNTNKFRELRMLKFTPVTLKRINRFKSIKRGIIIQRFIFIFLCLVTELWINSRALVVKYEGNFTSHLW